MTSCRMCGMRPPNHWYSCPNLDCLTCGGIGILGTVVTRKPDGTATSRVDACPECQQEDPK